MSYLKIIQLYDFVIVIFRVRSYEARVHGNMWIRWSIDLALTDHHFTDMDQLQSQYG